MTSPYPLPTEPVGAVIIGPREIYDAVVRTSQKVDGVSIQLVELTGRVQDQEQRTDARFQDHEARMRTLERARWPLPSVAVLCSVSALIASLVLR